MADKPTIGLTGGIASGKSEVSRVLERLGVGIVDADKLAREVVEKGSPGLAEFVREFGAGVLDGEGALDRQKLAAIVFGKDDARKKLQGITHPRIAMLGAERVAAVKASASPYAIYDAPLLVEVGAHARLHALIVVAADEATQITRLLTRDGMAQADAQQRIAAQLPLARKLEVADYVIHNDAGLAELEQRTIAVHREILARFGLRGAPAKEPS